MFEDMRLKRQRVSECVTRNVGVILLGDDRLSCVGHKSIMKKTINKYYIVFI